MSSNEIREPIQKRSIEKKEKICCKLYYRSMRKCREDGAELIRM